MDEQIEINKMQSEINDHYRESINALREMFESQAEINKLLIMRIKDLEGARKPASLLC